jgi:hypothetical protein
VHDAAVAADQDQPAGQAAVLHIAGEMPVDPGQPPGVEPFLARIDLDLECHGAPLLGWKHYLTGSNHPGRQPWTR